MKIGWENGEKFGPLWTAMVTPFTEEGEVDYSHTANVLDHLISTGTDVVVVAGTTGESPVLTKEEKLELFTFAVKHAENRVAIVAGTGSNSTKESIALTKAAGQTGVDGIMLVTPYYNRPSQEGLYAHFKAIANATRLPVMLYNVPGRTAVNMLAPTTIALSKIENIAAVKEASENLDQIAAIIEGTGDDFAVYSGDDSMALPILSIGGDGVVSVASHVIGNEIQEMIREYKKGDQRKAAKWHRQLLPVMKTLFTAPNPTCVKYALQRRGIDVGEVQLPLLPATELEKERVDAVLGALEKEVANQ
ncbi:4-hydroxy-tetrahydrodipicolinate synthase [Shouchella shacheensis]|uniref:4-hydroxy-tetrahydrodipicolinate synthase n=1 Tax=Shouchella shacheensis TaxID=1649580 RepID=UPI00073FD37C|nr:4-hydroxy-tetrahydrodipicolinate synthase [Shouchella shacheensis]